MYSQAQLEVALGRFMNALSEAEQDATGEEISRHVADPEWMDLIFHSNEYVRSDGSLDTPALARRILEYKPILL